MTVLQTERLTLRPLTGDDFDDYAAMMADPQVADGLADPIGRTPADAWRSLALFIGHREIRGYSHWAVIERATGHFVGRAGPWQPHGFPGLGVGWCLARPHWGKGYATEAARAAITYCFTTLKAPEVISVIRPGNTRSISVAERIGHHLLHETAYNNAPALIYGQQNPQKP